MIRCVSIFAAVLLVGCMSAPGNDLLVDLPREGSPRRERVVTDPVSSTAPSEEGATPVALAAGSEAEPLLTAEAFEPSSSSTRGRLPERRFTLKGGYYSSEDADELGNGYIVNLSWMQHMSQHFALEFELGYFDADGDDAGVRGDVWGIPTMVNGRVNVPVGPLDLYGGVGVGNFYYEAEADAGVVSVDADGWLFAGDAFFGATLALKDSLTLGLEAKYYSTEEIDVLDESLDSFALMLTLGFDR